VAVYDRPLDAAEMAALARCAEPPPVPHP